MIEPGSASRVPAGRFAAHDKTAQKCVVNFAAAVHRRQTRCSMHRSWVCARTSFVSLKKEKTPWLA